MLSFPILFIFFSLRKNIHDLENPKMAEENKTQLIKCQRTSANLALAIILLLR